MQKCLLIKHRSHFSLGKKESWIATLRFPQNGGSTLVVNMGCRRCTAIRNHYATTNYCGATTFCFHHPAQHQHLPHLSNYAILSPWKPQPNDSWENLNDESNAWQQDSVASILGVIYVECTGWVGSPMKPQP